MTGVAGGCVFVRRGGVRGGYGGERGVGGGGGGGAVDSALHDDTKVCDRDVSAPLTFSPARKPTGPARAPLSDPPHRWGGAASRVSGVSKGEQKNQT